MSWSQSQIDLQQRFWNFCKSKGMNEIAIAGAMGNISQESAWDITLEEVGGGGGYGLIQWTGSRRTQLEAYGIDETHQFNFFYSELTGDNLSVTGATKQWFNANGYYYSTYSSGGYSISESVSAVCWCFERPATETANLSYRQSEGNAFYNQFKGTTDENSIKVENAVQWLITIANDETHGYDQTNRWSPDYDCSSFVISGYEQAGIPLKTNGATYTGDMKNIALNTGFKEVEWNNDVNNLVRGDIILNETHHVCCYIGNGQIVQASINELGTTTGGQTGDQTGKEIYVRDFYTYRYGWDCVLRFGNGSTSDGTGGTGGTGGVPNDDKFDNDYFDKYERYFEEYDDLSEVYKKLITTPYVMNQLSAEYIIFLRTLNINDNVHMKFTFNHNKRQIGQNFLGKKLTFDNKSYIIKDVRNDGLIVLTNGGNVCYNYINPKQIYQNDIEKASTKANNVSKIKRHIKEEIEQALQDAPIEEV